MIRSIPLTLWMLLLGRSALAWAEPPDTNSAPPWRWPSLQEARPDSGRQDTAQLLKWMVSPDLARRSEAQIRLLARTDPLLPQLEALAARKTREDERGRMREYLQVLTLWKVSLEQLIPYPTLEALAQEGARQGLDWVEPWMSVDTTSGLELNPDGRVSFEGPSLEPLRQTLARLGGLARPALERWLAAPSAAARVRAIAVASWLSSPLGASTLVRLRVDDSPVTLLASPRPGSNRLRSNGLSTNRLGIDDDFTHRSSPVPVIPTRVTATIAALSGFLGSNPDDSWKRPWPDLYPSCSALGHAPEWPDHRTRDTGPQALPDQLDRWSARWFSIAEVHGFDPRVDGGNPLPPLRRFHAEYVPQDEQEYWNLVRPLWRAWWAGAPWRYLAWNREASNFIDSYAGVQCSTSRAPGAPALRIEGPPGAEVEVVYYYHHKRKDEALRKGPVPFIQTEMLPWMKEAEIGVRLRVGTTWVDFQRFSLAGRNTLWLQPELHQAFLQWSRTPSAVPLAP